MRTCILLLWLFVTLAASSGLQADERPLSKGGKELETSEQPDLSDQIVSPDVKWTKVRDVTEFPEVLIKAAEYRERYRRGSYKYKITKFHKQAQKEYEVSTGQFTFDFDNNRTSHQCVRKYRKRHQDTGDSPVVVYDEVYTEVFAAIQDGDSLAVYDINRLSPSISTAPFFAYHRDLMMPFEFRSLGFAFFAEYVQKISFTKAVLNYMTWGTPHEMVNDAGKKIWGAGALFVIEPDKGYWITENRLFREYKPYVNGKKVSTGKDVAQTACDIELERISGMFVPNTVSYHSLSERHTIELEWVALNGQLDQRLLEEECAVAFVVQDQEKGNEAK